MAVIQSTTTGGTYYTCPACGKSVLYGGTHQCIPYQMPQYYYAPPLIDEETKELLRQIVKLLEKLTGEK